MIEAMKQALNALELCNGAETADGIIIYTDKEIASVRQAIEAAEKQEPYGYFKYDMRLDAWVKSRDTNSGVAFYTHPPKREPLTDEQIINEADGFDWDKDCAVRFARAIEAKLRELNGM